MRTHTDAPAAAAGPSADDPRVAAALQEYLAVLEAGGRPDRAALLARHPDLAPTLAEAMDGLDLLHAAVGPPMRTPADPFPPPDGRPAATLLGDFRILREVGRGGMGVVYEAVQESLGRRVALKVLPFAAALDARQLQRFKTEAQAAAQLHHTNIVPVFAVGCDRGVHFYAMQFIDGQTLAEMIRDLRRSEKSGAADAPAPTDGAVTSATGPNDHSAATHHAAPADSTRPRAALSTSLPRPGPAYYKALARLGVQAAEALEYAHSMGVVHRDVKPANLMVDDRGNLWVTDFGLAQFHGGGELTVSGDVLGTLRYMSPEQAQGRRGRVDHHTDIYSLGVSLYELLTLREPYPARDRGELLRHILHEEPAPPRRRRRDVPPELETIVLKAMAKAPEERYATAQDLADDLRRFLDDQPIRARRPTLRQVVGKWMRRHRGFVWASGLLLAMGFVSLAVTTWVLYRGEQRTRASRAEARRAVDEMYSYTAAELLGDVPANAQASRQFYEKALAFYEQFAAEKDGDPSTRLELARAYHRVGDIRQKLGDLRGAGAAYDQAVPLLERALADDPASVEVRRELAGCLSGRGILKITAGRPEEAVAAFNRAIDIAKPLVAEPKYRLDLGKYYSNLGAAHLRVNRYDDARQCFTEALGHLNAYLNAKKPSSSDREFLRTIYHNLGAVALHTEQLDEAERYWNQCRAVIQGLIREQPLEPKYQAEWASNSFSMAVLSYDACRPSASLEYFRQAREGYETLLAQAPKMPAYRWEFARCLHGTARTYKELGDIPSAKRAMREAEGSLERLAGDFPDAVEFRLDLLRDRIDLANLLRDTGEPTEAEAIGRKALAEATDGKGKLPPTIPEAQYHIMILHNNLADYAAGAGPDRYREAEEGFRTAAAIGEKLIAADPKTPKYRMTLNGIYNNLGHLLRRAGQFGPAEAAYRAALAQYDRIADDPRPGEHPHVNRAWVFARLAVIRERQGQPDAASEFNRNAVESARKALQLWPEDEGVQSQAAWFFAAGPDPGSHDLPLAAELALKLTKRRPANGDAWRTVGLARLRQKNGPAAVEALLNARKYQHDRDRITDFLLALAYDCNGDAVLAWQEYDRACQRVAAAQEHGDDLDRFRAEADEHFRQRP